VEKIIITDKFQLPKGFLASGIKAGIKNSGFLDMALICSEQPAVTAGTFTSSRFVAAPVKYSKNNLESDSISQAIIVNSGNANSCTGEEGYKNAERMADKVAESLNFDKKNVLVASTGVIGEQLPMDKIENGIDIARLELSKNGGDKAAESIMTTDTKPKKASITFSINNISVTISGMAKGAGMIAPNMEPHATLLVFIMTDVDIEEAVLKPLFYKSIRNSFNRITIDGDMSTNDSAFIMANKESCCERIVKIDSVEAGIFYDALNYLLIHLAKETVKDGEGVTKFVTVKIKNAASETDAKKCAKAIGESLLCKTAWFGCDANWGRIIMALGASGVDFIPEKVDVFYEDLRVVFNGQEANSDKEEIDKILKMKEFVLTIDLKVGNTDYHIWTNDISYKYVEINAEYHT
jgi:glutamate N-acetyltransferase / amino-acid N-acetyltransferase